MLAALRLFTPLGKAVVVMAVVVTCLAAWLNWQEFTQLGVVAVVLLVLGLLWQVWPGQPVAELVVAPRRIVEGGAAATVTVDFRAGAAPMLFPRITLPMGQRDVSLRLPFLTPYAHHRETVPLPSLPRGAHVVGPVTYEKTDPLGLVSRRFETGGSVELLVSPRVTDLSVFAGGLTHDLDGATSRQLSMSDLAFHALREYVPGDDLRHVHWRSSAKAGELLVRQYHETHRGHVTVLVDDARAAYRRTLDFELAVSVAASIALRAVRDDFDTYLRCGPHVARGRVADAMSDVACRFEAGDDHYLEQVADAAAEVPVTGLVLQVTGAHRDLVQLDEAARRFGGGADRIVVRADIEAEAYLRDSPGLREISVPDLVRLRELFARGMR